MTPLTDRIADLMHPLAEFYSKVGETMGHIEMIDGADMPQPYRQLLVHDRDMTPTLEAYWGQSIQLQPMSVHHTDEAIRRQVVLEAGDKRVPVEFGAIKIQLGPFSAEACEKILKCQCPLGTILHDLGIAHRSEPSGYFRIASDLLTRTAFDMTSDEPLYGRHNVIHAAGGELLAEVVEILPPYRKDT